MRGVLLIGLLFVAAVPPSAGSSAPREQASRLVFAATVAYVGGEPQTQIYALQPSGRGLAQLTFAAVGASTPAPSPDGSRIAFERGSSIWVMLPNGSGQRLLAHGTEPAWTPDSLRIAYAADDGIHLIGSGGSGDRLMSTAACQCCSRAGRMRRGALAAMRSPWSSQPPAARTPTLERTSSIRTDACSRGLAPATIPPRSVDWPDDVRARIGGPAPVIRAVPADTLIGAGMFPLFVEEGLVYASKNKLRIVSFAKLR